MNYIFQCNLELTKYYVKLKDFHTKEKEQKHFRFVYNKNCIQNVSNFPEKNKIKQNILYFIAVIKYLNVNKI